MSNRTDRSDDASPWVFVQDDMDARRGVARVLTARNELVCATTPERADLIVCAVNYLVAAHQPEVAGVPESDGWQERLASHRRWAESVLNEDESTERERAAAQRVIGVVRLHNLPRGEESP